MSAVLFKANANCRHHIPKQKRRLTNWPAYDAGLRQRGDLTVWFSEAAISAWHAEPRTSPGGQPWYSPLAILTALTLRAVFHLALRQTEGLRDGQISRPDGLGDLATLGLTLSEAKQLLVRVQQDVVAAQTDNHAMFRPNCQSCGRTCHVKDWRPHRIATLFGEVRVRLARFLCSGCGRTETGVNWPSYCRSTPELEQLQARLSAMMPYRVAAGVLRHLLPIDAGNRGA
jgi:hypothetical protein